MEGTGVGLDMSNIAVSCLVKGSVSRQFQHPCFFRGAASSACGLQPTELPGALMAGLDIDITLRLIIMAAKSGQCSLSQSLKTKA